MNLQDRVYKYCQVNGLKLGWVAKQIRLDQSMFSAWLHGRRDLADYYIRQLEDEFAVPQSDFEEEPNNNKQEVR